MDYWIIDLVTMGEIKSQAILPHQIDGKEFYDKKTQKLLRQISESNG